MTWIKRYFARKAAAKARPAFPDKRPQGPLAQTIYPGISKRDYFAAAALTGINANSARFRSVEEFARYAYRAADAMLKESDHD